jgi:hypothetical protein
MTAIAPAASIGTIHSVLVGDRLLATSTIDSTSGVAMLLAET